MDDCSYVEEVGILMLSMVKSSETADYKLAPELESVQAAELINCPEPEESSEVIGGCREITDLTMEPEDESQDEIEVVFERLKSSAEPLEFISIVDDLPEPFSQVEVPIQQPKKNQQPTVPATRRIQSAKRHRSENRYFSEASSVQKPNKNQKKRNLRKRNFTEKLQKAAIHMCISAANRAATISAVNAGENDNSSEQPSTSTAGLNNLTITLSTEPRMVAVGKKKLKKAVTTGKTSPKKRKGKAKQTPAEDSDVEFIPLPKNGGPITMPVLLEMNLRPIVIDASNVAMSHGQSQNFSCRGIWLCAEHWRKLGHKVYVVLPSKLGVQATSKKAPVTEAHLIDDLEKRGLVVWSPTRKVIMAGGATKNIKPYDDRLIVQIAHISGAVIISNDHYKDIMAEHPEWRETLEKRIVMYTWLSDVIIFPTDPLGRHGPHLEEVIRFPMGSGAPSLVCSTVPSTAMIASASG